MPGRTISVLRSIAAVIGGYVIIAAGTILTFNVLVGQVTVNSPPQHLILGTIGAAISGIAGGFAAAWIAPDRPMLHAGGVLVLLALDTASVLAKGTGPVWFDLAGSSVLALTVLLGAWIFAQLTTALLLTLNR